MTDSKPYHSRIEVYKGNREELLGRFKPGATQGGVRRAMSAWQGCGYLEDSEGFTVTFACRDAAQGIYSFYAGEHHSRFELAEALQLWRISQSLQAQAATAPGRKRIGCQRLHPSW